MKFLNSLKSLKTLSRDITRSDARELINMAKVLLAIYLANRKLKILSKVADSDHKINTLIILKQKNEEVRNMMSNIVLNFTPDRIIGRVFQWPVFHLDCRVDEVTKHFNVIASAAIKKNWDPQKKYDPTLN